MFQQQPPDSTSLIPSGFSAIPVHIAPKEVPIRLCALVREKPDPAFGPLVLLRSSPDANVYAGCITDAGGRVREWVEIWVQSIEGLSGNYPTLRDNISNHLLDLRWQTQAELFRTIDPDGFWQTGWESSHPCPTFLDLSAGATVHPMDGAQKLWNLCEDDSALVAAGLPAFTKSLARYWWIRGENRFVPAYDKCPESPATIPMHHAVANLSSLTAFNPQGGYVMVRNLSPLSIEEYADLLGGKPWSGLDLGKKKMRLGGAYRLLDDWNALLQSNAYLFSGIKGKTGRFLEVYHLKLQLLLEAFGLVRAFVQKEQLPFLSINTESFRVRLGSVGAGLPWFWTARCTLARPGQSVALPVKTSSYRYFIPTGATTSSIFLPEGLGVHVAGTGSVRLRKVTSDRDGVVIEGTLSTQERLTISPHDLVWLQLPLQSGRVDLYGNLNTVEGLAAGEARFRTVPQKLSPTVETALREAEGVVFTRSQFEIVPLLSTACDLYALGVVAVRVLLVDDRTSLPIALDEMLSLARQVAVEHKPDVDLAVRIGAILERDARYRESLGPQHLCKEVQSFQEASALLPQELWWDTLGFILRLFPGIGPDSVCRNYGDVPALALETSFDRPTSDLQNLLRRSRSLILTDWQFNREISATIQTLLTKT